MHIEQNYCFDPAAPNPYHTSLHAADVTLTVAHFCENSVSLARAGPEKNDWSSCESARPESS